MVIKFLTGSVVSIHPKGPFGGICVPITTLGGSVVSMHLKGHF